jgi:hypothetical protein
MIFCTGLEVRDVKRKYALEEARTTGRPPKIEVLAYNTNSDVHLDDLWD